MTSELEKNAALDRRLAAIVFADVAGYSRMVAEDEAGTIMRMRELRDTVTEPAIRAAGGRVVKRTGDGTLVEFASVLAAAQAAVDVQRRLAEIAASDPDDRRFLLRIGLHLGEVLVEADGDIHGDGVNVAARLEALCAPGEILVSGAAWQHLDGRLDLRAQPLGSRELKNIPRKVALHRLVPVMGPANTNLVSDPGKASLPLADKPSIVVLPFRDMSKDHDATFLADGLVEDIITALSHFRSLFVIARNTAFTYRDRATDIGDVGRELGVQYALEGSVRRVGDQVRVTAQLIDATADRHIWAQKYDRRLDDVFEVQDDLTEAIVMAVAPSIRAQEIDSSAARDPSSLSVREKLARGWWHLQRYTAEDGDAARLVLDAALEESPGNAAALAFKAQSYVFDGLYGWSRPQRESLQLAIETANEALASDPDDENAQVHLAIALFIAKRHSEAVSHLERVLESNPNHATAMGSLGMVLTYMHDPRADVLLERAARLSPRDVWTSMFVGHRGMIAFIQGDDETALAYFSEGRRIAPRNASLLRGEVTALAHMGRMREARERYASLLEVAPGVTQTITRNGVMFMHKADADRFCEGLARAGMPE